MIDSVGLNAHCPKTHKRC